MYRHYAPAFGALSGEGARRQGGRWNPPDSFAALYTATDVATVDAEFDRTLALARLSPGDIRPRELATIRVDLQRVLDLRDAAVRDELGVRLEDLVSGDVSIPRAIGKAAHHLGYEAIVAPSATGAGDVIAIFLTNQGPDSSIDVVRTEPYSRRG